MITQKKNHRETITDDARNQIKKIMIFVESLTFTSLKVSPYITHHRDIECNWFTKSQNLTSCYTFTFLVPLIADPTICIF